jgi:hypothetical protein
MDELRPTLHRTGKIRRVDRHDPSPRRRRSLQNDNPAALSRQPPRRLQSGGSGSNNDHCRCHKIAMKNTTQKKANLGTTILKIHRERLGIFTNFVVVCLIPA